MTILEALQSTNNHELALKTSKYLLKVYQTALEGCQDSTETTYLKQAFSELLQTAI